MTDLVYGDNTKAALMTRGLAEIARLGKAMGANEKTFMGLSGVGDLIVTCTSMHSRNRRAGILLGQGKSLKETLESVHMVVEGVNTQRRHMKWHTNIMLKCLLLKKLIIFCTMAEMQEKRYYCL